MPIELRDHQMDWEKVEGTLWGTIPRSDPMYRPAIAAIRHCKTMMGAMGAAQRLRRFFMFLADRDLRPADATVDDIEDYIASFGPDHPVAAESHLAHVKVMYDEAVFRGVLDKSPATRCKIGRYAIQEVPALTLDQVRQLLDQVRSGLEEPRMRLVAARDYALLTVLVTLGPRASELRGVAWGDLGIDSDPPTIQHYGKGRSHRTVRLPAAAVAALRTYRDVLEEHEIVVTPEDAITMGLSSVDRVALRDPEMRPIQPMSYPGLRKMIHNHLVGVGLSGHRLGMHRLRATAATLAHLADANVVDIAAMLGHARVDTTVRHYIRPANSLAASPADRVPLLEDDETAGEKR